MPAPARRSAKIREDEGVCVEMHVGADSVEGVAQITLAARMGANHRRDIKAWLMERYLSSGLTGSH